MVLTTVLSSAYATHSLLATGELNVATASSELAVHLMATVSLNAGAGIATSSVDVSVHRQMLSLPLLPKTM